VNFAKWLVRTFGQIVNFAKWLVEALRNKDCERLMQSTIEVFFGCGIIIN